MQAPASNSQACQRLLIIVPIYASFRAFLKGLAVWLAERGWEVHVATNLTGVEVEADVAYLHHIDMPRGADALKLFQAGRVLTKLIREIQPTVVHAHFSVGMLCLALAGRIRGVSYLGTFQGMRFPLLSGLSRWIFKLVECFSILRLDHSWVLTEDDYGAVPPLIRSNLTVQDGYGFGCDIEHFDPARFSEGDKSELRADLGISNTDFVYIYVGRLTEFKNFPLVLDAFRRLREKREGVHLLVVGEKDSQHPIDLPDLTAEEGICHVGWQDDPAPYFAIANTMIFPSYREGMPVCMMEAIAMGLPVITSAARGCVVLAQLSKGDVVDPLSVEGLVSSMLDVIEKSNASGGALKLRAALDRIEFYQTTLANYGSN